LNWRNVTVVHCLTILNPLKRQLLPNAFKKNYQVQDKNSSLPENALEKAFVVQLLTVTTIVQIQILMDTIVL
jgi:hypothetical protein